MENYEQSFNYENCLRNEELTKQGYEKKKQRKTGTTIAGIIFKDGVVLGADTRATEGYIVADGNCEKIHRISDYIYCCGAGTSADTENTTALISSKLELMRLTTGREPRVQNALTLLKQYLYHYHGYVSAALVLGGVDFKGPHLHMIHPHGSTSTLPFLTMGSGSLAAMAVFEAEYKTDLDEESAKNLVHKAITAGIFNDLGSGGNVDLCVMKFQNTQFFRNFDKPNKRKFSRINAYRFPKGTTQFLEEKVTLLRKNLVIENLDKNNNNNDNDNNDNNDNNDL
ncbi:proteasome subunit beta type-7 [Anaeramoeba ignava]|uniref:Proteasome subunit beta n=1 Tax=Anaeramoeba ignava TaxID=1746090 RepID=A0A9Q0LIA3_ANAIG|nr:proteasome subunit beta type-7 [Anaeramoeba ignava]